MRILFQGDSITDADRSRNDDTRLGTGYPRLVEASLGYEEPAWLHSGPVLQLFAAM